MSSIFTIGPVAPETFTVWSYHDGVVVQLDEMDVVNDYDSPAQAA